MLGFAFAGQPRRLSLREVASFCVAFWELVMVWGIPLPSRSTGMMELEENLEIIYGAQQLTGKILSRNDLASTAMSLLLLLSPWL